jgi:hypothetical protein
LAFNNVKINDEDVKLGNLFMLSTKDSLISEADSATGTLGEFLKVRGCTTKLKKGLEITLLPI